MAAKPTTTEEYLDTFPADRRTVLQALRTTIRTTAPRATEMFSYGMPGFAVEGKPLIWYAAWKDHYSLYPIGDAIRRQHAAAMNGFETAKGTIRFPASKRLPIGLIRKLVRARLAEVRTGPRVR